MRRFVAVGSSTQHDYAGFLPAVGTLWRERIGYEPIFFLVGSPGSWAKCRHGSLVPDALTEMGFRVEWVVPIEGVEEGTIAQSIRLHAAALQDLDASDILIPSDADLLPLRREFYYTHDLERYPVGAYYSNGYGDADEGKHFPSCHVSARVDTWRELMRLESVSPRECMKRTFQGYKLEEKIEAKKKNPEKEWGHVWFADEFTLSTAILSSRFWPSGVQLIRRQGQPPKDRLDRSCWPASYRIEDYSDCHSIRPFWSDDNYPRLRPLFEATMPQRIRWFDEYRAEFKKRMDRTS